MSDESFKFDVSISQPLRVAKDLWRECFERSSGFTNSVVYLKENDKDFIAKHLYVSVNCEEFSTMLNGISETYPMLKHFSAHYSSWRGMRDDLLKDINEYISLCDSQRGEGE